MKNVFSNDTLLARWLSGELTEAEKQELADHPDLEGYQRLADAGRELKVPAYNATAELARLQRRRKEEKSLTIKPARRRLSAVTYWSAAAAAILVVFAAWMFWPKAESNYYAEAGTSLPVELADGSSTQLNAVSTLSFSTGEQRLAKLEGEAFFEVKKSTAPFVVRTDHGSVTVLGTSFNVFARDGELRVACKTGRVRVAFDGLAKPYEITPGQSVARNGNSTVMESATDEEETFDWTRGTSVFNKRPLKTVISELERQFDLEVKTPPGLDVKQTITTAFNNDDLEQALRKVLTPLPGIRYERTGRIINLLPE